MVSIWSALWAHLSWLTRSRGRVRLARTAATPRPFRPQPAWVLTTGHADLPWRFGGWTEPVTGPRRPSTPRSARSPAPLGPVGGDAPARLGGPPGAKPRTAWCRPLRTARSA